MSTENFSHITLVAIEAALLAGEILRQGFGSSFAISSKKGVHNLVTEYDHKAEQAIISFLREHMPDSHFLAEESGEQGGKASVLWIIDPLDGTVNFAHQIPCFAVSIGARKDNAAVCGVVYQPLTHELFVAERGKGAFLNGKRIGVTRVSDIKNAFLATGFPYNLHENPMHCIEHFVDILRQGIPLRRLGAAAIDLAYVASGRFDAFFEVSLAPWDCAAGMLLIEEAGGKVSHWDASPFDLFSYLPILATNGPLHPILSKLLQKQ